LAGIAFLALIPGILLFQDKIAICMFRHFTGIECPFCGMTRACYDLIHMKVQEAFHLNPVGLLMPVLLVTEAGRDFLPTVISGKMRKGILIVVLMSFTILFIVRIVQHYIAA
jgi:hypothetical protein